MLVLLGGKDQQGIRVEKLESGEIAFIVHPDANNGTTEGGARRIASTLGNKDLIDVETGKRVMRLGLNAWL